MTTIKNLFSETKLLLRNIPSLITALFVTAVVSMNLLANKSIDLNLSWLALDCGILFSWLVFLLMDVVTKRFGVRAANILAAVALLANLAFSLIFLAMSYIPGTWSQSFVETIGGPALVNGALDGTFRSSWYVILGSSVAFMASAVTNNVLNFTFGRIFKAHPTASFYLSCYLSTVIGQFLDNILFAFIVSYHFFGWTALQCVMCAATGAVAELVFEVVFSPLAHRIVLKYEAEGVGQAYIDYVAAQKEAV